MKNKTKQFVANAAAFLTLASARANYMLYCDDAFDQAGSAAKSLQTKLTTLADSLFPLAMIICCVCMFFTRDPKKFEMETKILIGVCLAYALIVLIGKGTLTTTITNLFSGK